jgi:hypothetical protein
MFLLKLRLNPTPRPQGMLKHEFQHIPSQKIGIIIIIIISCHRFSFFPGTSALEPVVNPTTQASSLSL